MAVPDYPKRPAFFAHKFVRLMGKVCLGAEVGPETCWLLTVIAHTEDAAGYRRAVTFVNEDLATRTGLSISAMRRARDRAVKAGWLHHTEGAKRRPAAYFVLIPDWVRGLDDAAGDESSRDGMLRHFDATTGSEAAVKRPTTGSEAAVKRQRSEHPSSQEEESLSHPHPQAGACACGEEWEDPGEGNPPRLDEFVAAWDAAGLQPAGATAVRRGHWQNRWLDPWFRQHWRAAVERAGRSARCRGDLGQWRATASWFLRDPDAARRILEGEFDDIAPADTPEAVVARLRAEREAANG